MNKSSSLLKNALKMIFSTKGIITFCMGFASGLPLLLTTKTLQAWLTEENISLTTIGVFNLVGLPYSFKFLWSPLLDYYIPPFLGRRRGWLIICQLILMFLLFYLGIIQPNTQLGLLAVIAFLITFFSATQDIVIDAYRREHLQDNELSLGSSLYMYGYRIAMWIAGGLALGLADYIEWKYVYFLMGLIMGANLLVTFLAPEPKIQMNSNKTINEVVIAPFKDFLQRNGAITILLFILLYKLGDTMAGSITTPFYLLIGFSKTSIAAIVKTFGLFSTFLGAFIGGTIVLRIGFIKSLYIFGILQALSTLSYSLLTFSGTNKIVLTFVIAFEDMSSGMGTAAFMGFMASLTNKKYTASQYALLTSLMAIPRNFFTAPTGFLAKHLGWNSFFILCTLIAIPGLILIHKIKKRL